VENLKKNTVFLKTKAKPSYGKIDTTTVPIPPDQLLVDPPIPPVFMNKT